MRTTVHSSFSFKLFTVLVVFAMMAMALPLQAAQAAGGAPTRFYLQNAAAAVTPATRGAWNQTAGALTLGMSRTKSGVITNIGIAETSATNNWDVLLVKFVSEPIPAQTIAAGSTLNWVIGAQESSGFANMVYHVHAYVVSNDGGTLRGTLLADDIDTGEWNTTAAGDGPAAAQTLSAVTAQANDRIVIEIGYQAQNNSATSYTGRLWYGGTGSDLNAGGDETTLTGWFEFSQDLFPLNSTTAGTATATAASTTSISVSMPYVDDGNANNTYTVEYKLASDSSWTTWVSGAAHTASPYTTTITGLTPGTLYDVRLTYNDADGVTGTNPQTFSVLTLFPACSGSLTYTAPAGTNRVVVVIASVELGTAISNVQYGAPAVAATQIATVTQGNAQIYAGYWVMGTSATPQVMNITTTGATCVYATTYQNINQNAGNGTNNTINSIATDTAPNGTTTTSVNVFNAAGGAVNNAAGGRVVYAINMNQGTADGQVDLGTSSAWTFVELFDKYETVDGNRTGVGQSTTTSAGSATVSVTATTGHNRSAMVAFALNPYLNTAPTISTPIADTNVLEDAANTVLNLYTNFADTESTDAQLTYSVTGNTNAGLFTSVNITDPSNFTLDFAPDANGTADITVRATDPGSLFVEDTFTVTVAPVNDAPSFGMGGNQSVNEDAGAQSVANWATAISAGPANESAQTLTFTVTNNNNALFSTQPAIASDGTLTYTPAANANGSATVTVVSLQDNGGTTNGGSDTFTPVTNTFTITVNAVNDAPVCSNVSITTGEDTTGTTLPNCNDVDGDTLTYSVVDSATNGTGSFVDPNLTYIPDANFNGTDSFTYSANDGTVDSNSATVNVAVNAVNDAPVCSDVSITTNEDTSGTALPNCNDVDGDTLTYSAVDSATNGTGSFVDPNLTYIPNANFNGTDSFTYSANDGTVDSNSATVNVTVNAVNDAPVCSDASITTNEDTTGITSPNCNDVDGDTLTYSAVDSAINGAGSFVDPDLTYVPDANFNGTDSFTYSANDGTVDGNSATVNVTVNAVNDTPTLTTPIADVGVLEDAANTVFSLYPNFADVEDLDAQLSYSVTGNTNPGLFTAVNASDPANFTLDFAPNANGTADITVRATDTGGLFVEDTFTVTVTAVNDAPVCSDVSVTTNEDTTGTTLPNCNDVDGDTLAYSAVDSAANGTGSFVDPNLIYIPDTNFNGTDSFTYTANDGTVDSNSATVNVAVNAVNDAPVCNNVSITTNEDATGTTVPDCADIEGDTLTYSAVDSAVNGTGSFVDPNLTYIPDADFNGTDSFTYTANDGTNTSNAATVNVTVNPVNDAPVCSDVSITTNEDTTGTTLPNCNDVDGDMLTYNAVNSAVNGTGSFVDPNLTYIPDANFFGTDSFTYSANDGTVNSNSSTVNVTVNSVNDAPICSDVSITTNEDTTGTTLPNCNDVEGDTLTYSAVDNATNGTGSFVDPDLTYVPDVNFSGTDSFTYSANDGTDDSNNAAVNVTVNGVNDPPTVSAVIADVNVFEDAANTVFSLYPSFADLENLDPQLTYTITGNTNPALFTSLNISNPDSFTLDYAPETSGVADITIRATDTGGLFVEDTFRVTVTIVDDTPTNIDLTNNVVDENQPAGTLIGTLTSDDVDSSSFTYSLVLDGVACPGATAFDNSAFQISGVSGDELQTAASLDFETQNSYTICIQTSDGNSTFAEEFTVTVNDLDDTAPYVVSSVRADADPTSAASVDFTVTFSESVTGVNVGDFALTTTGTVTASVANVSGSGTTWTVTINTINGDGTLRLDVVDNDSILDTSSNALGGSGSGNGNFTTGEFYTIDQTGPDTTILTQPANPTSSTDATFTYSSPEAGATFECSMDGNAFAVCPANYTGLSAGSHTFQVRAVDTLGNADSSPASYTWTIDLGFPTMSASTPANNGKVTTGPTQLIVRFSEDVKNDGSAGAGNTAANYLLVENGANTTFETLSCSGGAVADDTQITIDSVLYTNNGGSGPFVATLNINGGVALPAGKYRLFVCGTTSIEDLAGNELNNGLSDAIVSFTVAQAGGGGGGGSGSGGSTTTLLGLLPATGFPMNQVTTLPAQPVGQEYASTDLWLEIPRLGVKMSIVGVPQKDGNWDVKWLDKNAGWLNGSAYPTWNGNSVLTGHVWDALNRPGPFAELKKLKYGDQIKIHAFGQVYIYEVRENTAVTPADTSAVFKHEEKPWLTLVTCEDYKEDSQTYSSRRMVRAVLVSVTADK